MRVLLMGSPSTKGYLCYGKAQNVSGGGWIENLIDLIASDQAVELFVCFYADFVDSLQMKMFQNVHYLALPMRVKGLSYCNLEMCEDLRKVLRLISPDVVHIIGTEREHNLRLFELSGENNTVISITGLVSACEKHYFGGINLKEFFIPTLGDFLRRGGPIMEKKRFHRFSISERALIRKAKYVFGRTTLDYACVKQINPDIKYMYCGECLNPIFHEAKWNISTIQRFRIFVSQGSYPLKGLHMLLEAFPEILKRFPDSEIYIAGANILKDDSIYDRIKRTTYARYIRKCINRWHLPMSKIHFIGALDAFGMLNQYLKCNAFVLPSAIENSPNSLGEAMILGVPCVASCVGGVQDMIKDREDGFIYPFDEPYMLAHYVCNIFEDENLATRLSENARENASKRFDPKQVKEITINTYKQIAGGKTLPT